MSKISMIDSKYIYKQINIWGVETYIIHKEYYRQVIELLEIHSDIKKIAYHKLEIAQSVTSVELYPAVIYWYKRFVPVLCYRIGDDFYHVYDHGSWMCRECWHNNGLMIMPLYEAETDYYDIKKIKDFEIPKGFHKINCSKCGKPLQNHLIAVEKD